MKNDLGKGLAIAAATGILMGLAGCGGGAQPAAPPTTLGAEAAGAQAKEGCPGKPGEKHVCGAGQQRDDGKQSPPATISTSDPSPHPHSRAQ